MGVAALAAQDRLVDRRLSASVDIQGGSMDPGTASWASTRSMKDVRLPGGLASSSCLRNLSQAMSSDRLRKSWSKNGSPWKGSEKLTPRTPRERREDSSSAYRTGSSAPANQLPCQSLSQPVSSAKGV